MMKKLALGCLIMVCSVSFTGCGGKDMAASATGQAAAELCLIK